LLALAVSQFEVFLTVHRNLSFQQDVGNLKIAVVVMVARGNKHSDPEGTDRAGVNRATTVARRIARPRARV
jgi:hypothetical protein